MPTAKSKRGKKDIDALVDAAAFAIQGHLFGTPFRGRVTRLVQELDSEFPGGGWSAPAVRDVVRRELKKYVARIARVIVREQPPKRKAGR